MKPSEALEIANSYLTEHTWVNREPALNTREMCTVTAISWATAGMNDGYWEAADYMKAQVGQDSLTAWNDAPGRTLAEVKQAFEKAILKARKAGD